MGEKMTEAVATLCIGEEMQAIAGLTHLLIKKYAERIGAQFIVMRERLLTADNDLPVHFEKYQLRYLLELFDRVIFIDTDAFPVRGCLSLFDLTPADKLGVFVVSEYTDIHNASMHRFLQKQPHLEWDGQYFNSGVMVLSRCHRDLFSFEYGQDVAFGEQTQLNINRLWTGTVLHDIGFRYNHTTVPAGKSKEESYILHYPGMDKQATLKRIRKEIKRRRQWI
jgi:hypothetical protein